MKHLIEFVSDTDMPAGKDWSLLRSRDKGVCVLYLRKSARKLSDEEAATALENAWTAYRLMSESRWSRLGRRGRMIAGRRRG